MFRTLLFISYLLFQFCYAKKSEEYVLLISMDGFRFDYLEKTETPNFDKLISSGVTSDALVPVFISFI